MKVIIAGGRDITDSQLVIDAVRDSGFAIDTVVSGCQRGVDRLGELWAISQRIPVHQEPADWNKSGKAAGPIRNRKMAAMADALIAIWDGESRGTKNMIDEASKKGLVIYIKKINTPKLTGSNPGTPFSTD